MPGLEEILRRRPDHPSAPDQLAEAYRALGLEQDAAKIEAGGRPLGEPTPVREAPAADDAPPREPDGDRLRMAIEGPREADGARRMELAVAEPDQPSGPPRDPDGDRLRMDLPGDPTPSGPPREPDGDRLRMDLGGEPEPSGPPRDPDGDRLRMDLPPEPLAIQGDEPPPKPKRPPPPKNPRSLTRGGAAVTFGGPAGVIGAYAEFRPHWAVAVGGGVGAAVRPSWPPQGSVQISLEATAMPVPFRLTPTVGVGMTAALGPLVWAVDGLYHPLVSGPNARLLPWIHLGARYDFGRLPLWMSVGLGLLPSGNAARPVTPSGGLRVGARF